MQKISIKFKAFSKSASSKNQGILKIGGSLHGTTICSCVTFVCWGRNKNTLFKNQDITLEGDSPAQNNKMCLLIWFGEVNGHSHETPVGFRELFPRVHKLGGCGDSYVHWATPSHVVGDPLLWGGCTALHSRSGTPCMLRVAVTGPYAYSVVTSSHLQGQ